MGKTSVTIVWINPAIALLKVLPGADVKMEQPKLHIQNLFDVLNPFGVGVNGYLKIKALQVQNRVVCLSNPGDIVSISDDCPPAYVDYILRTMQVEDVLPVRYFVNRSLLRHLSARSVFEGLQRDSRWPEALARNPVLDPYMQSSAVYKAARRTGIKVNRDVWRTMVIEQLAEKMNDKVILHRECDKLGLPVPMHWIAKSERLKNRVIALLKAGHNRLYIRQARSAGALGNITVEQADSQYIIYELANHALSSSEFIELLEHFARTHAEIEFVITELLDLSASPGTLFFADDDGVAVICHANQILTGDRRYVGFIYPIEDTQITKHFEAIERAVTLLIEPWRKQGFRGYGNLDWMVTKDGDSYIAERNARQTAVIPALKIDNELVRPGSSTPSVTAPHRPIITQDRIYFDRQVDFEDVYDLLKGEGLLLGQRNDAAGVVIMIPPSPAFGINSAGIMVTGDSLPGVYEVFSRALKAMGREESELLFKFKV